MPAATLTAGSAALRAALGALYRDRSKHSVYQSVPSFVAEALGYQEPIDAAWRCDLPRYRYLEERLMLPPGAAVADVGANTGFFSLTLAQARPDLRITAFEPNPRHAEFIRRVAEHFSLANLAVRTEGWDLAGLGRGGTFDAVLLLNIVHHAGFDFDRGLSDDNAAFTDYCVRYLRRLRELCPLLAFQVGSNRGGDKARPLFAYGDDGARLDWLQQVLGAAGWRARSLGYPRGPAGAMAYGDAPAGLLAFPGGPDDREARREFFSRANLAQFPGEFHRRPLAVAAAGPPFTVVPPSCP